MNMQDMTEEEINSNAGYLCLFSAIISANKHPVRNAHATKKQKGQETIKGVDVSQAMKYRKMTLMLTYIQH